MSYQYIDTDHFLHFRVRWVVCMQAQRGRCEGRGAAAARARGPRAPRACSPATAPPLHLGYRTHCRNYTYVRYESIQIHLNDCFVYLIHMKNKAQVIFNFVYLQVWRNCMISCIINWNNSRTYWMVYLRRGWPQASAPRAGHCSQLRGTGRMGADPCW